MDNSSQPTTAWSYDTGRTRRKCVERYCELAGKTKIALKPAETPCMHDPQVLPEDFRGTTKLAPILCADSVDMPVLGLNWET